MPSKKTTIPPVQPEFYLWFREVCGWEKEAWSFLIPLTEKNLKYMNMLNSKLVHWKMTGEGEHIGITSGSRWKFLTMPITRAKALDMHANGAGGYMKRYNLLAGEVKVKPLRHVWGKKKTLEEALYKGGIKTFFDVVPEEAAAVA